MKIGGFQKVSLSEFPGRIAAIVFTQGCNFRCPYCHNPELVDPDRFGEPIPVDEILAFLQKRRGRLDGVSITGGEPLLQEDLPGFLLTIKEMGFEVKLDTNGSRPDFLRRIIIDNLIDYIAMDIKSPLDRYQEITLTDADPDKIRRSIAIIMESKVDYEFRTTVAPPLIQGSDIVAIARMITGSRRYALHRFQQSNILNTNFRFTVDFDQAQWTQLQQEVEKYVTEVIIRF